MTTEATSPESVSLGVVIAAGGSGSRFGRAEGKQLALLAGRPVLCWSLEAFSALASLAAVVLVAHPDRIEEYASHAASTLPASAVFQVVAGGDTRQESVAAGVSALPTSCAYIAVHDGARPLVTAKLIAGALAALVADGSAEGVVVGHPAVDTLKHVHEGRVVATPDRTLFWSVQTPQIFRSAALRYAYERAAADGFVGTDDSSLVERLGGRVLAYEGSRDNIKVTHAEDLSIAEAVLRSRAAGDLD